MRGFTFLTFLFLALLATTHAYMDPIEDGEDENDDGELDGDDNAPRKMGERCGSNKLCGQGLDCVRFPIRRKCMPVSCGVQAFTETIDATGFDLEGYGSQVMSEAGVTMRSNMFRRVPDAGFGLFNRGDEDFQSVYQAIQDNKPPTEFLKAAFYNCTGWEEPEARQEDTEGDIEPSTSGLTPYFGASWELGLLGTYNGDIFWG